MDVVCVDKEYNPDVYTSQATTHVAENDTSIKSPSRPYSSPKSQGSPSERLQEEIDKFLLLHGEKVPLEESAPRYVHELVCDI